eukprot:maker-scaffold1714_size30324-snap-gene-0.10 protein:Tk09995 transcript:maker-scaffold1714_size30324-snap-gene-0.10-mRNA-1 annotation:"toxin-antitoxin antitoxin family"
MNNPNTLLFLAVVSAVSVSGSSNGECPNGEENFLAQRDLSCIPNVDDQILAATNKLYTNGEDVLKNIGLEIVQLEEKHFRINKTKKFFVAQFGPSTFKNADGSDVVARFTIMGKGTPQGIEIRICGCQGENAESFCNTFLKEKIEARVSELAATLMAKNGVDESQCGP